MIKSDDETPESVLDLALDSVPAGACAYVPYRPRSRPRAPREGQRDSVGWELTRDPVYER